MSAVRHWSFGSVRPGLRLATPTISETWGSAASALTTLVPAFPLAPVTTTRMPRRYPPGRRLFAAGAVALELGDQQLRVQRGDQLVQRADPGLDNLHCPLGVDIPR